MFASGVEIFFSEFYLEGNDVFNFFIFIDGIHEKVVFFLLRRIFEGFITFSVELFEVRIELLVFPVFE